MHYYLKARKPSGIYYICWTDAAGRPQGKSTGTRDWEKADDQLTRHKLRESTPKHLRLSEVTLDAVLLAYWEHRGKTRFATDVIKRVIVLAAERVPMVTLDRLTLAEQEKIVAGFSPPTQRRYLAVIGAAMTWAARRQIIEYAPGLLQVEAEDGEGARPYTPDDLRLLLASCEAEHERRLLVLLLLGPRPQAALQLTWDRIKAGVADFHVPGRRRTKKRRTRTPLPSLVARWLEARRGLGPVVQYRDRALRGHRMTFQRIAERAGIEGTAYGVRKAVATWLRQQSVPEWEIGALLGHRVASATTERYAHHRPDFMRATVIAMETLLAMIRPSWLDTPETVPVAPESASMRIKLVPNGNFGSRGEVRTLGPFHVKEGELVDFQQLKPANDD